MSDPVGFFTLLLVAAFGLSVAFTGFRRGKCVALAEPLGFSRTESPIRFWYGIGTQFALGLVCLVLAIVKATQ
ncbi:MAG: hypothetical protein OXT09_31715 [Myxococcales bacterium]|nr:hypothetical protein [Myxococcales bacterium]